MARRKFTTFSLSFLDIMSCGFGAVVLVFLIIEHASDEQNQKVNQNLFAEVNLLEEEILDATKNLVRARNTVAELDQRIVEAQGASRQIIKQIEDTEQEIARNQQRTLSNTKSVEQLQADVAALEQQRKELEEQAEKGNNVRRFVGDGDRQYLTGLKVGGKRVLILLDKSASMMDQSLVEIIRKRKMPEYQRQQSPKWRQAVSTVDWLTAQLPPNSSYQIYLFNEQVEPALPGTRSQWLSVKNQPQLEASVGALQQAIPDGGTNLAQAFVEARRMVPPPDNIILLTDGLPTLGLKKKQPKTVSARERLKLFRDALDELPGAPVNTILFPMEGDPLAAPEFWKLAIRTQGAFLTPARDWP